MTRVQLVSNDNGKDLLFTRNSPSIKAVDDLPPQKDVVKPWKLMIIDDEDVVHQVTMLVLDDYSFEGRPLEIIQGYSAAEAKTLLREHPDTAVLLLDVVMESDTAGLDLVGYIREELKNRFLRIILRTGQPGQAPEKEVISRYEINDYREKTELTAEKLYTSITTSLRAYSDLRKIESLSINNKNLEARVRNRTLEIMKINEELQLEVFERNRAYEKLKQSEARLNQAQKMARIGNWEYDFISDEMICSDQVKEVIGVEPTTICDTYYDLVNMVIEEDKQKVIDAIESALKYGESFSIEHRMVRDNGQLCYIHQQGDVELDKDAKPVRIAGTIQDITQRFQTEQKMRKLSGAVEQIADAVMITNSSGVIEYINPAFEAMTGYSKEEIIGKTPRIVKSDKQSPIFYRRMWETILSGEVFSDVVINRKKSGELYYEEKTITPQKDRNGNVIHFISTGKDVTERIEAQERLHFMAHHDSLTGLPNRILLQDRLTQALSRSPWRDRNIAVLFMDVDRFKVINDTLGHDVGDTLLKEIAQRLLSCVRDGDTVSRLGGDEFAIVLNDIALQDDVEPIAEKILTSLSKPLTVDGQELFITASIGISMYPRDGKDSQELLKKADVAMYRVKSQGKDNYQLYNPGHEEQSVERLSMESRLRRALEKDEFNLNYQPQLNINTGKIVGFEALLRWHNEEMENVSPMYFIPILEETGMINAVGDWVLQTACMQEKAWQNAGLPPHRIAVNLSIRQFQSKGLIKRIDQILTDTGLAPEYLELEITEGLLIDQITETAKTLHEFHEMGICLSIDDFGTGYSSMNYLKRLPFDTLKIDRMFVRDITYNTDDAAIATAIISLAHTLGMEVVAEGVETGEQLEYLQTHGCDAIQGYLFSPPLTTAAVMELIKKNNSAEFILPGI